MKPGVAHPAYSTSLLAYGALKVELGEYVDAERLYGEGGDLVKAQLGELHPYYGLFLNNRGFLFQVLGNRSAAEADYRHSLQIKQQLYGPGSLLAAGTLRNLAQLTYSRDRPAGERLLTEAAAIYAKSPTAPPFEYSSTLLGLARAQRDRGALAEARATLEQALTLAKAGLGDRHPLFAAATRDLGLVDAAAGDAAGAERNLREAIDLAEQAHGPRHPDLAAYLDALAGFHVRRGNYQAALPLYRRSLDIQDRFAGDVLKIGSESVKAASLAAAADPIPVLIDLQQQAAQVPEARTLAFEAVTRRKGRVLEQVWAWRQQLRDTATDAVRRQLAEWQAVLECRTSLTVALGYRDVKPSIVGTCGLQGTDLEDRYDTLLSDLRSRRTAEIAAKAVKAIDLLQDRGDALETALARETGKPAGGPSRVTLADIRSQLGADEMFIEFVSYESTGRADGGRRYGAFVLDSGHRLDWRDLGPAAPIDALVQDLLAAANDWSLSVRGHERQAARASERTARDALANLSRKLWSPLRPLVESGPGFTACGSRRTRP